MAEEDILIKVSYDEAGATAKIRALGKEIAKFGELSVKVNQFGTAFNRAFSQNSGIAQFSSQLKTAAGGIKSFGETVTQQNRTAKTSAVEIDGLRNSFSKMEAAIVGNRARIDSWKNSMLDAGKPVSAVEREVKKLESGLTTASSRLNNMRDRLDAGATPTRAFATAVGVLDKQIERAIPDLNKFNDATARVNRTQKSGASSSGGGSSAFLGGLAGGAGGVIASQLISYFKESVQAGIALNTELDKLIRYTATLDSTFQTASGLKQFKKDIEALSIEVPQTAENIAKASFTVKSSYGDLREPELIDFLRELSVAATASNSTVDKQAESVIALAKAYGVTGKGLVEFNTLLSSTFGEAIGRDEQVAEGLNRILVSAKSLNQPLNDTLAVFATIQKGSSNAAENTTLLSNLLSKFTDGKYREKLNETFKLDTIDEASGKIKNVSTFVNELADKLKGLSDAEKAIKLGEIFKDKEAREGIQTLLLYREEMNRILATGGNVQAYKDKTNVMLNSTEARWAKYSNYVENLNRDLGGRASSVFLSGFEAQSGGTGLRLFFINLGAEISNGTAYLIDLLQSGTIQFQETVANWIGLGDPTRYAKMREDLAAETQKTYQNIAENRANYLAKAKDDEHKYYQAIADDPTASETLKTSAKKSLDAINAGMQQSFSETATANLTAWKKIGEDSVKGLESAEPAVKAAAQKQIESLNLELVNALSDPKYSDGVKEQIRQLWTSLPATAAPEGTKTGAALVTGIGTGIEQNKPTVAAKTTDLFNTPISPVTNSAVTRGLAFGDAAAKSVAGKKNEVASSANNLFNTPTAPIALFGQQRGASFNQGINQGLTQNKPNVGGFLNSIFNSTFNTFGFGSSIGANYTSGIKSGMASGFGQIHAFQTNQLNSLFSTGKQTIESRSPSRRSAREIGKPFAEGIAEGIRKELPNSEQAVKEFIDGLYKGAKKQAKLSLKQMAEAAGLKSEGTDKDTSFAETQTKDQFDRRLIGLDEYVRRLNELEQEAFKDKIEALRLKAESDVKEAKTDFDKQQAQIRARQAEIEAFRAHEKRLREIADDAAEITRKANEEWDAENNRLIKQRGENYLAELERQVTEGTKTEAFLLQERNRIKAEELDYEISIERERLKNANLLPDEEKAINLKIQGILEERKKLYDPAKQADATKKDLEKTRQDKEEIFKLRLDTLDIQEKEIEQLQKLGQITDYEAETRRNNIDLLRIEIEQQRVKLQIDEIDGTLKVEKNEQLRKELILRRDSLVLRAQELSLEGRNAQSPPRGASNGADNQTGAGVAGTSAANSFFNGSSLLGGLGNVGTYFDQLAEKWLQSSQQAQKGATGWKNVFGGVKSAAASTAKSVIGGLQSQLQAFIETGKFSLTALRKQIADELKARAISYAIDAAFHFIKGIYYASNPFTAWKAPGEFTAAQGMAALAAVSGGAGIALGIGTGDKSSAGAANGQAQSNANSRNGVDDASTFNPTVRPLQKFEASVVLRVENIVRTDEGKIVRTLVDNVNNNGAIRRLFIGSGDPYASY